jgi:hypothetical protein
VAVFAKRKSSQQQAFETEAQQWQEWEAKRNKLIAAGDVTSRAELRKMRDVYYDTDAEAGPGEYFNPSGLRRVRGSDGKHRRIMSGQRARQMQGAGL